MCEGSLKWLQTNFSFGIIEATTESGLKLGLKVGLISLNAHISIRNSFSQFR